MEWLLHGPIGDMPGPEFLVLYMVVIGAVLGGTALAVWLASAGAVQHTRLTPIDAAFLREGEDGVALLLLFELVHRGYLWVDVSNRMVSPAPTPPSRDYLEGPSAEAAALLSDPKDARTAFDLLRFDLAQDLCRQREARFRQLGYLAGEGSVATARAALGLGLLVILGLGGYKLTVALIKGYTNVGFLVLLAIIGSLMVVSAAKVPRLTTGGRAALREWCDRLAAVRGRARDGRLAHDSAEWDYLVAAFGVGGMAGSAATELSAALRPVSQGSDVSYGCSGGSSCSSGSSCSGGSSCGGGGCGGCGS